MKREVLATYRLQLNSQFGFEDAAAIVDYLADLGVSHIYCSPCLQAAPGSSHGYDVVDHSRLNSELGGEAGFTKLCEAARRRGMSLVIDIVPNHMAINSPENLWWWDVLENGPSSKFASYFDVDWDAPEERLRNIVLLPILADHYGRVLESGEISLVREGAEFRFRYKGSRFPVAPRSLGKLLESAALRCHSETFSFIADGFSALPLATVTAREEQNRRHRAKEVLRSLLTEVLQRNELVARTIDEVIAELNANYDELDALLERQNYRLAYWRTAERDLGYRRFFDINDLVGLRTESEQVFRDIHALPLRWISDGLVEGLRVDHVDGLRDPAAYLSRLHDSAPHAWIVVEKILMPFERLPDEWPIAGTTGYEFLNLVNGLYIDPAGKQPLADLHSIYTDEPMDFDSLSRGKKYLVMNETLGSDLNRLTALFLRACERDRRHRDYTRHQLHEALREVAASFPVYRTYMRRPLDQVDSADRAHILEAVETAKKNRPELGDDLLNFLRDILFLGSGRESDDELVMRFQQFTPPVMAKGVEDTAFYGYNVLLSLNEVGGSPDHFGTSPAEFYQSCVDAGQRWPRAMLASSTHDTKRSGDVRARLNLLSEIPEQWSAAVARWMDVNRKHWSDQIEDRNAEYHLYQTLVGAWPIELERVLAYMRKATREAKLHTSWTTPNTQYEEAIERFVTSLMHDELFIAELEEFVSPLIWPGRLNALSQTLIKLTAPGVPDFYQGTEVWDLTLVDPDNRRPVNYMIRRWLLDEFDALSPAQVLSRIDEGLPKLWLIRQALRLRARQPSPFLSHDFRPLPTGGDRNPHLIAFSRADQVIALAPRLVMGLAGDWRDTRVELPVGKWLNELSGSYVDGGSTSVGELLSEFPVGLLSRT